MSAQSRGYSTVLSEVFSGYLAQLNIRLWTLPKGVALKYKGFAVDGGLAKSNNLLTDFARPIQ